jgi:hypothetical protein
VARVRRTAATAVEQLGGGCGRRLVPHALQEDVMREAGGQAGEAFRQGRRRRQLLAQVLRQRGMRLGASTQPALCTGEQWVQWSRAGSADMTGGPGGGSRTGWLSSAPATASRSVCSSAGTAPRSSARKASAASACCVRLPARLRLALAVAITSISTTSTSVRLGPAAHPARCRTMVVPVVIPRP